MKKVVFVSFLLLVSFSVFSQTAQIKSLESKRKEALREIENTNRLLLDTKKTTATLLDRIKLITSQIKSRQELVSILNRELDAITKEQAKVEGEIKVQEANLALKQENYATAIKGMLRKKQNSNRLVFILSGKSFGESLRRLRYMRDYSDWRNEQAEEIKKEKEELLQKKQILAKNKKDKQVLLVQRKSEEANLKSEEVNRQQEVSEANKKQKELQVELSKKQKQAAALNSQIERLIAEEVARQQREAKRIAEEKARAAQKKGNKGSSAKPNAEPTIKVPVETKESFQLSNNFVANKGKFPMPVTGSSRIVTRFGQQHHKQWNVTTNSNGIDIQAQAGSEARAIFQGEVSRIIVFPGYNNCVIVRHGNYYTFYGNIQQVYVKQGDKVSAGQSIGSIYTDPEKGTAELHFQLWRGTVKQNPELWLR